MSADSQALWLFKQEQGRSFLLWLQKKFSSEGPAHLPAKRIHGRVSSVRRGIGAQEKA